MSFAQLKSKAADADGPDLLPASESQLACWAAVSFAYEDAAWCDWIYREFDGTRVPRSLAGRPSREGIPYPERISVSPDPADSQQLENYGDTLKRAQHLLLVISPTSAHSELTQEHMRIFRAAGGEERIIALVVKGEPASPSAEPGSEQDAEWLPKWLQYRFQNNQFEAGPPSEPTVIDGRMGVSSLAEIRAKLCASLLEVKVSDLAELGVVIRATAADLATQKSPVIVPMPEPTPLPTLASIAMPEEEPQPATSRWPVLLCSVAAITALGCLAFWPASKMEVTRPTQPSEAAPVASARADDAKPATGIRVTEPLVAVVPVDSPVTPAETKKPVEKQPAKAPGKTSPKKDAEPLVAVVEKPHYPQPVELPSANGNPTASKPAETEKPTPNEKPVATASKPPVPMTEAKPVQQATAQVSPDAMVPAPMVQIPPDDVKKDAPAKFEKVEPAVPYVMTAEAEAVERKRYELASRRDRLVRLAEAKVNAGELDEAIESFSQAAETAQELVDRSEGGHDEVLELALLFRRFGNVAATSSNPSRARDIFERGRRSLNGLRLKGKLPREAFRILADLEASARTPRE